MALAKGNRMLVPPQQAVGSITAKPPRGHSICRVLARAIPVFIPTLTILTANGSIMCSAEAIAFYVDPYTGQPKYRATCMAEAGASNVQLIYPHSDNVICQVSVVASTKLYLISTGATDAAVDAQADGSAVGIIPAAAVCQAATIAAPILAPAMTAGAADCRVSARGGAVFVTPLTTAGTAMCVVSALAAPTLPLAVVTSAAAVCAVDATAITAADTPLEVLLDAGSSTCTVDASAAPTMALAAVSSALASCAITTSATAEVITPLVVSSALASCAVDCFAQPAGEVWVDAICKVETAANAVLVQPTAVANTVVGTRCLTVDELTVSPDVYDLSPDACDSINIIAPGAACQVLTTGSPTLL